MHHTLVALLVVLALVAPSRAPDERSYRRARAVLDSAIAAAGGSDALGAIQDVTRTGRGILFNQGQSLTAGPPYTTRAMELATVSDFAKRRTATEVATTSAGNPLRQGRFVVAGDAGWSHDRVTSVVTPLGPGAVASTLAELDRDPAVLLRTAARRADTLRSLGSRGSDDVLVFADADGTQITLSIDSRTHLVSRQATMADDPVLGDTATEILYSDYRSVAGVKLPFHTVTRTGGEVTEDVRYSRIEVNAGAPDHAFERPANVVTGEPFSPPSNVTLTPLGSDAYLVGGSSHNSLFVVFKDHVLLVEAPQSGYRTEQVLAKIRETAGDRPVRYVVATHGHFDHIGGLRSAIAAGATVVTTPGNRGLIDRLVLTAHTIRPDALSRRPCVASVELVAQKRVFTDGVNTVEIHSIGPNPHATEILVAYLPAVRTVFVSDLFNIPLAGPVPPAGEATRQFADALTRRGLAAERIAPGHGRLGTAKDLSDSLARTMPALPPVGF